MYNEKIRQLFNILQVMKYLLMRDNSISITNYEIWNAKNMNEEYYVRF